MSRPSLRALTALLIALALITATGCGASTTGDGSGSGGDDVLGDGSANTDTSGANTDASDTSSAACPGGCPSGEVCREGACAPASCEGVSCDPGELCDAGLCVSACPGGALACGGVCCGDGEGCDEGTMTCEALCASGDARCGGSCCDAGQACDAGQCRVTCAAEETRCGDQVGFEKCCEPGRVCEDSLCLEDCGQGVRCGFMFSSVCCAPGDVCEENVCKTSCSGARCGENEALCCVGAEQCLFDACIETHGACADSFDCQLDEFCEPSTLQCVKVADDPNQCQYVPPVGTFAPSDQWHWSGSSLHSTYDQVMMTPIVVNLTDDNGDGVINEDDVPDVVFSTFTGNGYNNPGVVRVVSGDDGRDLAASNEAPFSVSSDLGAADLDGDGLLEIVVSTSRNTLPREVFALNLVPDTSVPTGYALEIKDRYTVQADFGDGYVSTSAAFADLEGDGAAEVVMQFGIMESDFTLRCEAPQNWHASVIADLDEDGVSEIIAGGRIFDPTDCSQVLGGGGSFAAVADLLPDDGSPEDLAPEIVWIRAGVVEGAIEIWNVTRAADGTWGWSLASSAPIPINQARISALFPATPTCTTASTEKECGSGGGPPTIADFDGDGQPEIGLAARWYYLVAEADGSILWADANTKDYSSAATGSSVFDFEGDGAAEVVYNDEGFLRVYKGSGAGVDGDGDGYDDAEIIFETPNPSGTLRELPLIVDADNDGNAEIVVAANNYAFPGVTGVRVLQDPLDNWVRTRRIWNQHTYHVTHINEDGSVPSPEPHNWRRPGLNNFRQNVQPGGLFNAPDLSVTGLDWDTPACPGEVDILITVSNEGSLGVTAGTWVAVYAVNLPAPEDRALLGHVQVAEAIPPGAQVTATLRWDFSATLIPSGTPTTLTLPVDVEARIDDVPAGVEAGPNGAHNECVETNNTSNVLTIENCGLQ